MRRPRGTSRETVPLQELVIPTVTDIGRWLLDHPDTRTVFHWLGCPPWHMPEWLSCLLLGVARTTARAPVARQEDWHSLTAVVKTAGAYGKVEGLVADTSVRCRGEGPG